MKFLNILIISDNPSRYNNSISAGFHDGCRIYFCGKKDNIILVLEEKKIKIVIIDIEKSDEWESKLIGFVKHFDPIIEVVLAGPPLTSDRIMDYINLGASDYLLYPFQEDSLRMILNRIEEKRFLRKETYKLETQLQKKYIFHGMVGKSPFMLEIFSLIETVAKYFTTVLITGETGTGKELAAKAIHDFSPVKNRKFVVCDCAALPENLIESELFGYVKGAFTGADKDSKGLFEEAQGGTIFLDEIGETSLSTQAKLLRVLENRSFRPLGSNCDKEVNVKIIAATNKILDESVKTGKFREDLYHRLNKVEIHLPPLRERAQDIPLLIKYYLYRFNKESGKKIKGFSREVQKFFLSYKWPGNVRELKNVVESAGILCKREFIDIPELPRNVQKLTLSNSRIQRYRIKRPFSLQQLEEEYIAFQLKANQGNIKKTAEILGISRTTLYSKIDKHNIESARN